MTTGDPAIREQVGGVPFGGLLAGYGSIGRRHLANLYELGVTDWSVVHTGAGSLPFEPPCPVRTYASLEEALASERPRFAVIANPTALHVVTALACVDHGCDLLIEKPVSHTLDGLGDLARRAAERGAKVLVGFQFRFDEGLARVKRLLEDGNLGPAVHLRAIWGEYLPDWHPWEDWRNGYAARPDLGGGVHHTLCHPLDYVPVLLGEPVDLRAELHHRGPLGLDVAEAAEVTLRFVEGTTAQVHLNYWSRPPVHRVEVFCAAGTIVWDHIRGEVKFRGQADAEWTVEPYPGVAARHELFRAEARHFLEVVEGTTEPICPLEDGVRAVRLCRAIGDSAAAGRPVTAGSL